ncbi:MAG TPA: hypothetical protein VEH84_05660 [Alphaproteobacteria bacterium]|nr:hypothetical protein [Alphaproteobacteria bacterium]
MARPPKAPTTLKDFAQQAATIAVTCRCCGETRMHAAAKLMWVLGPRLDAASIPYRCADCRDAGSGRRAA